MNRIKFLMFAALVTMGSLLGGGCSGLGGGALNPVDLVVGYLLGGTLTTALGLAT